MSAKEFLVLIFAIECDVSHFFNTLEKSEDWKDTAVVICL